MVEATTPPTNPLVIILRISGDVSTKSKQTRARFTKRIAENIADALRREGIVGTIRRERDRFYVKTEDEAALEVVKRVFGVQAAGMARSYTWRTMDDVVGLGHDLFVDQVRGKTFAVRVRRVGDRSEIPFTSKEVELAIADKLYPAARGVNLKHPEALVPIELRGKKAYFYIAPETRTQGGLPVGIEGRALALLSGGFDSAVAAWSMLKRGVELDYVFFNLAGPPQVRAVRQVLAKLVGRWAYGTMPRLHIVDLRPAIAEMKGVIKGRYWQIVLKRLMIHAAERIADAEGHLALVTGEAIGQVSSQALGTLGPIATGIRSPVLRPLISFNKDEIIALSRIVGTHDVSAGVPEFCALGGGRPATRIRTAALDGMEGELDAALLDQLVAARTVEDAWKLEDDSEATDLTIDHVPDGAAVIDLRSEAAYGGWHYPNAIHLPFEVALVNHPRLPRDRTYVFCCEVGLKSAVLAEKLHAAGVSAFNFGGGLKGMVRYARRLGLDEGPGIDETSS